MKKSLIALSLAAAAASALTVAPVSAQDYGYDRGSDRGYDRGRAPCAQVQHNRGTSGAVLGALAGAVLGSNLASHHGGRSGGAVLGALAGAAVGNNIGRSSGQNSGACRDQAPDYYTETSAGYGNERGAFRAEDLNQREARLGGFIRRQSEDGALSRRDARDAWQTLRSITDQHRAFYDRDGGYLTPRHAMMIRGRLNELSRFVRSADMG